MSRSFGGEPIPGSDAANGGISAPADTASSHSSGTVETAASEGREVVGTAAEGAEHVIETARAEAGSVAGEAQSQVKELYAQAQSELREQAGVQQQRVAEGLRSVGDELSAMADSSDSPGLAADLVRQVSTRLTGAAGWMAERDPGSLLTEVKTYARRKPGTFIAIAALAGLAAGRLTRALTESASDTGSTSSAESSPPPPATPVSAPTAAPGTADAAAVGASGDATPVYDQARASFGGAQAGGGSDDVGSHAV